MRILVLSTWFPYPLIYGSKIRAYHLIKALADRHEVGLCSFADTPIEAAWLQHLETLCSRVEIIPRSPFAQSRPRTMLGWFRLTPSAMSARYSQQMAERVRATAADWRPERMVALTIATAPYARRCVHAPRIVDLDNVVSRMLDEEYRGEPGAARALRRWLAWKKFERYERVLLGPFERCVVVSDQDRHQLQTVLATRPERVTIVPNGVDTSCNRTGLASPRPDTLIFTGTLTYSANYDAMDYFLREVFPRVRAASPAVRLRITGTTENVALACLPLDDRTTFTGHLPDVRTAVAESWVCVVPLRIGGGTRVKILEAMALGTPVVSTPKGAEGLDVVADEHLLIGKTPAEFAAQTLRLLRDPTLRERLARNARCLVEEKYTWADIGRRFRHVVEGAVSVEHGAARDRRGLEVMS